MIALFVAVVELLDAQLSPPHHAASRHVPAKVARSEGALGQAKYEDLISVVVVFNEPAVRIDDLIIDPVTKDLAARDLPELRTDTGGIINALLAIIPAFRGAERRALQTLVLPWDLSVVPSRNRARSFVFEGLDRCDLGHQWFAQIAFDRTKHPISSGASQPPQLIERRRLGCTDRVSLLGQCLHWAEEPQQRPSAIRLPLAQASERMVRTLDDRISPCPRTAGAHVLRTKRTAVLDASNGRQARLQKPPRGTAGVRAEAAIPLGARNRLHRSARPCRASRPPSPESLLLTAPASRPCAAVVRPLAHLDEAWIAAHRRSGAPSMPRLT